MLKVYAQNSEGSENLKSVTKTEQEGLLAITELCIYGNINGYSCSYDRKKKDSMQSDQVQLGN